MTHHRYLSRIGCLIGFALFLLIGCSAKPLPRPNVFLIVLDTTRADHLSSYGYERKTSPNLDRLAKQGVLYENCISPGSWTLPSHASMFTGLFTRDHHTTSENRNLDEGFDTLAELLREAGYRTGGFSNNVWTNKSSGLQQGFDTFREMWREQRARELGKEVDDLTVDMGAAKTNERVFEWLDGFPDHSQPFFIFINYFEPHVPYRPTQPYDDDFLPEGVAPELVSKLRSFSSPKEYGYMLGLPGMELSDEELTVLTALYDGEIAYVDSIVGRLVEGLKSRKLLDNTLLVFTSDHGEHFAEHGMLDHKFSVYDALVRVPLIMHYPAQIPAGRRIKTLVQSHDVFGTILNFSQARDESVPGLPLEDADPVDGAYAFAELTYPGLFLKVVKKFFPKADVGRFDRSLSAVRGPRYKLIAPSEGAPELYDITVDPNESRNLAQSQPAVVDRMQKALRSFKARELP